jgi:hypothetical protein
MSLQESNLGALRDTRIKGYALPLHIGSVSGGGGRAPVNQFTLRSTDLYGSQ